MGTEAGQGAKDGWGGEFFSKGVVVFPSTERIGITSFVAFSLSLGGVYFLLRFRDRLPLDRPNDRSLHKIPVPRVGGVALVAAFVLAVGVGLGHWTQAVWGALFLSTVSFLDDRFELPVLGRLSAHLLSAIFFVGTGGGVSLWVGILSVLVLVWAINLFNFMDGSDGLAGGMAVVGFSSYALRALGGGATEMGGVSLALAGAAAGFLVFNFHPARIFLGDSGSIPLGFLAGALGLEGFRQGLWPLWFPPLVFAPFVYDATVTLLRRLFRREPFWKPHRTHYYQRLVQMGWGHRRTALTEYALMAFFAGLSFAFLSTPRPLQWAWVVFSLGVALALMAWVDRRWKKFSGSGSTP